MDITKNNNQLYVHKFTKKVRFCTTKFKLQIKTENSTLLKPNKQIH